MSDTKETITHDVGAIPALPIVIHAQYIKDISFENPNAPNSLRANINEKPSLDLNIVLDAQKLEDPELPALYEVVVTIKATSQRAGRTDFIVEASYGVAVSLNDVPEDKRHPLLFIEIPRQIFPYARQGIAQLTQGGGYPPLYLQPVDFQAMYIKRFGAGPEDVAGHA